jgi:hypothetical protein
MLQRRKGRSAMLEKRRDIARKVRTPSLGNSGLLTVG